MKEIKTVSNGIKFVFEKYVIAVPDTRFSTFQANLFLYPLKTSEN